MHTSELLKDVSVRWKTAENADGSVDNTSARRYYRIKVMARKSDMSIDIPGEIPTNVISKSDYETWSKEIIELVQESQPKTNLNCLKMQNLLPG